MVYIGVVGPLASGKGIVSNFLIKHYGFVSFSLSFIVHDELKKRGIQEFTRTTLQDIGDGLRKQEGNGALAKRAMIHLSSQGSQNVVIEGIRNPGEVEYLRTIPNFFLIAVEATKELRYRRVIERGKPWDPKDWKNFIQVDARDQKDQNNHSGQQVQLCMNLADYTLVNNSDLEYLYKQIAQVLQKESSKNKELKKIMGT